MSTTVIFLIVVAILVFWTLGAYNRLVRQRAQVARRLQALALQWQTQVQHISERLEQYAQGRETESQWASLDDDALRWRPLLLAARQFLACLSALQTRPEQLAALDDASAVRAARDIFETAWQRLQATQDDLAGTNIPPDLSLLWAQHEPAVQEKLRDYNQAVQDYHEAIGQFPAVLLAWLFGFGMTAKLS